MLDAVPEQLNLADWFLDARLREGRGDAVALRTPGSTLSYAEVAELSARYAGLLAGAGVQPEQRVIIALPDSPEWVAAFFGILRSGAVVVMLNPQLGPRAIAYFLHYTRATAAFVTRSLAPAFPEGEGMLQRCFVVDEPDFDEAVKNASPRPECFPSHRDDPAIWLFSGGTTGRPKGVVQPNRSFLNTTRCYGHGVIGYRPDDVTLSVPKLYFGYATGSNLLFPFSVGASVALFPERCTPETLFAAIARHRPSILVNVPTMIHKMLNTADAGDHDLSCLRLATSAGEALPAQLHRRWDETFGVELLDGLGTAEQWHIFLSNRPGDVNPGTLGKVVPGFEVKLCDEHGQPVPDGQIGALWVAGGSRALRYWQQHERTMEAFRGRWYVSGDMLRRNPDGTYVYCGRCDDILKVSGKWLVPGEVENVLLQHLAVQEVAVIGMKLEALVKPIAFVVPAAGYEPGAELEAELQRHVREALEPYKAPRAVRFRTSLPRTHLGKVDRGALRREVLEPPHQPGDDHGS